MCGVQCSFTKAMEHGTIQLVSGINNHENIKLLVVGSSLKSLIHRCTIICKLRQVFHDGWQVSINVILIAVTVFHFFTKSLEL